MRIVRKSDPDEECDWAGSYRRVNAVGRQWHSNNNATQRSGIRRYIWRKSFDMIIYQIIQRNNPRYIGQKKLPTSVPSVFVAPSRGLRICIRIRPLLSALFVHTLCTHRITIDNSMSITASVAFCRACQLALFSGRIRGEPS